MPENLPGAHTTVYSSETTFITVEGLVQVPVNGKTNRAEPSLVVRVHSPMDQMVVTWTAVRKGGPPKIPHPLTFSQNLNVVLLAKDIGSVMPVPMGNQQGHSWCVSGTYTYALRNPREPDAPLPTGKMPFDNGTPGANTIPETNYDKGILATDNLGTAPPITVIIPKS